MAIIITVDTTGATNQEVEVFNSRFPFFDDFKRECRKYNIQFNEINSSAKTVEHNDDYCSWKQLLQVSSVPEDKRYVKEVDIKKWKDEDWDEVQLDIGIERKELQNNEIFIQGLKKLWCRQIVISYICKDNSSSTGHSMFRTGSLFENQFISGKEPIMRLKISTVDELKDKLDYLMSFTIKHKDKF